MTTIIIIIIYSLQAKSMPERRAIGRILAAPRAQWRERDNNGTAAAFPYETIFRRPFIIGVYSIYIHRHRLRTTRSSSSSRPVVVPVSRLVVVSRPFVVRTPQVRQGFQTPPPRYIITTKTGVVLARQWRRRWWLSRRISPYSSCTDQLSLLFVAAYQGRRYVHT